MYFNTVFIRYMVEMESPNEPPFTVSSESLELVTEIGDLLDDPSLGSLAGSSEFRDRILSERVHSTLAIENNPLTSAQISDILHGVHADCEPVHAMEVENAYRAYRSMIGFNPVCVDDLLNAHRSMMGGILDDAGRFRRGEVAVYKDGEPIHLAPPAVFVPLHVNNLIDWFRRSDEDPLVKSCVFHYEFEFIHPFSDGNGRTGRLWQSVLLSDRDPVFEWLPVEIILGSDREAYFAAIRKSTRISDSSPFIVFMLRSIRDTMLSVMDSIDRPMADGF